MKQADLKANLQKLEGETIKSVMYLNNSLMIQTRSGKIFGIFLKPCFECLVDERFDIEEDME